MAATKIGINARREDAVPITRGRAQALQAKAAAQPGSVAVRVEVEGVVRTFPPALAAQALAHIAANHERMGYVWADDNTDDVTLYKP